jgi:hypothetical protein
VRVTPRPKIQRDDYQRLDQSNKIKMAIKLIPELGVAINCNSITSTFHGITVHPTFFFDASSERQRVTAEAWAGGNKMIWTGSKYIPDTASITPSKVRQNVPMNNLWLDNLESRMEGGRAYKVINKDDMTYFDVREDQMLQAILKYGIQAGGKIGGEWIFAMNGTQCKCFLTDSTEYQEALSKAAIAPKEMIRASYKNLKIGTIYSNKNLDQEYVYVGFINQETHSYDFERRRIRANVHTFAIKNRYYGHFMFSTPSVVYETGRSMNIDDLVELLKSKMIPESGPYNRNHDGIDVQKDVLPNIK